MGGIETHLEVLATELCKKVDLRVVVANDDRCAAREIVGGVSISRIPTWMTAASTPLCPGIVRAIRESDADIVHLHFPNPMAVLGHLASGHKGRLVFTYHSDTVRQKFLGALFEPFLQQSLRRASAIITTSLNYLESSSVLTQYRERCHVIPYGIDVAQFQRCDPADAARIRQRFGHGLILSVGRLVYYKGFEYLIRAMSHVNGKLVIVGDGPLRRDLEDLAAQINLTEKVVFVGEVQNRDVIPYYHAADVFALASIARSEAFGIVQIEAMAAGLPIVNTKLDSGVPFVSLHNQTGFTVPPRNPVALGDAIGQLLNDSELRRAYGHAARIRAQQEFSLDTMVRRTLSLYERVLVGPVVSPKIPAGDRI
jgi:rhamnosyl/mannosyltransferase